MRLPLNMSPSLDLTFANGLTARAIRVQERTELTTALSEIGLQQSQPVLVVVGGASNLSPNDYKCLENLFTELLAPLAEELGMTVIDGGTDAGIMQLMGAARAATQATFPLVGVAPIEKVHLPGRISVSATQHLEPHHTHFVLVPGDKWGDESPWIAEIASILSGQAPSITVLVNGGTVALRDVQESIAEERLVVVISGTGRLADRIATAVQNPQGLSSEALSMLQSVKADSFKLVELAKSEIQLKPFLQQHFLPKQRHSVNLR